jgi:hypothetical protein
MNSHCGVATIVEAAARVDIHNMDPGTAFSIALESLAGETTRFGEPLIEHVARVADTVPLDARAVAYLHDVLEHSNMQMSDLEKHGLEPTEREALGLLTRAAGESYEAHALRIAYALGDAGALARVVKHADLVDHLDHGGRGSIGAPPYAWALRHITASAPASAAPQATAA